MVMLHKQEGHQRQSHSQHYWWDEGNRCLNCWQANSNHSRSNIHRLQQGTPVVDVWQATPRQFTADRQTTKAHRS